MKKKLIMTIFLILLLNLLIVSSYAQSINVQAVRSVGIAGHNKECYCSVSGVVKDSKGNKVNNAFVSLKGVGQTSRNALSVTNLTFKQVKAKNGYFSFLKLSPGKYRITLKEGETRTTQIKDIEVKDGENREVEFCVQSLPKPSRR